MAQRYASRSEAFNAGEDGRLVINDSDDEGSGDAVEEDNEAENYYMQAQNSADGFTRGQGNKIKFKKRGKESMFDDDMMEVDDKEKRTKKKIERKLDVIGKEYRSKVGCQTMSDSLLSTSLIILLLLSVLVVMLRSRARQIHTRTCH